MLTEHGAEDAFIPCLSISLAHRPESHRIVVFCVCVLLLRLVRGEHARELLSPSTSQARLFLLFVSLISFINPVRRVSGE